MVTNSMHEWIHGHGLCNWSGCTLTSDLGDRGCSQAHSKVATQLTKVRAKILPGSEVPQKG